MAGHLVSFRTQMKYFYVDLELKVSNENVFV